MAGRRRFSHKTLRPDLRLKQLTRADPDGEFSGSYAVYLGDQKLGEVYQGTFGWTAETIAGFFRGAGYTAYATRWEAIEALIPPTPQKKEHP